MLPFIIAGAAALGALAIHKRPADFRASRAIHINAPAAAIFPYVNDLRKWHSWSPFAKMDPAMVTTFTDREAGVGAAMSWRGAKSGVGTMTITEADPAARIICRLDFEKPMRVTNIAEFTFTAAESGGTEVRWSMFGKNNFRAKVINLIMNCEKMCGRMFDSGLADLKAMVEAA